VENAETDVCQRFDSVYDLHVDLGLCRLQLVCFIPKSTIDSTSNRVLKYSIGREIEYSSIGIGAQSHPYSRLRSQTWVEGKK